MTSGPPQASVSDAGRFPSEPPPAPTAAQQQSSQEWDRFSQFSLDEVTASATTWKEGLASVASSIAAGLLLIKVPDATSVEATWRVGVVVVALLATISGLVSLWWALTATAGTPSHITREEFENRYRTVDEFRRRRGSDVVARLRVARVAVILSVIATVVGAGLLWFAPDAAPRLRVQSAEGTYCGLVDSADRGEIHLAVDGERDARVVKLEDVQNMWVVTSCGS